MIQNADIGGKKYELKAGISRSVSSETRIAKISRQSDCHQLAVSVLEGAHLWHREHEWKPLVIAALSGNRRQLKAGQECVRDKCRQFKDILKWLN